MTHAGPGVPAPPRGRRTRTWPAVAAAVAAAGVLATGALTGWFGTGGPDVGDCVRMVGESDFESVECGAAGAEFEIVSVEARELTRPDAPERILWSRVDPGEGRSTWRWNGVHAGRDDRPPPTGQDTTGELRCVSW